MAYRDDYDGGGYIPEEPQGPISDPFADQLTALYAKYGREAPDAASLQAHRGNPGGLGAIENMLIADWDARHKPAAPVITGGGGAGPDPGPAAGYGSLVAPFTGSFSAPTYSGTPSYVPQTPQFRPPNYTPPPAFSFESFKAPTADTILQDPSFNFRLDQGRGALENSAAAKGVLNGGGTLKDILGYGQNFASQEYGNIWNRDYNAFNTNRSNALNTYLTNYQTQYADPYAHSYQSALDQFAPEMTAYSTQAQAGQRAEENSYNRAYEEFLQKYRQFTDQRDSTFDKQWKVSSY